MLRRLSVLSLALAVAVAPATASARTDGRAAPPSLRQLAKRVVAVGAPGALVVVRDATGTRGGAAGYADLRTKQRLSADHTFRVGSVTKTFVATAILQLVAEGVVRLDDSVEQWLPGLVPNGSRITLRQLLNHTSGVFNYTDDTALIRSLLRNPLVEWAPATLVGVATRHAPLFPPGTGWSYSNTGYILLGLVVEKATGAPLADELHRRIFQPLGLTRTSLPSEPTLGRPFARGYALPGNGVIPTPGGRPADVSAMSPSWAWAAGGVVSTARELARFYTALLRGELLRAAQLAEMKTTVGGGDAAYGLGLLRADLPCRAWGHGGSVPGYLTLVFASEDGRRVAVVLVNATLQTDRQGTAFEGALASAFCR